MATLCDGIRQHYSLFWKNTPQEQKWLSGPLADLPPDFRILEFPPTTERHMWTYATCGMCVATDAKRIELHLFSPIQTETHLELLTAIAHFHRTGSMLDLGQTVNFGRPWRKDSICEYGLISLPHLDGPSLERCQLEASTSVNCYWLIPISRSERDYKKESGLEALEAKFEERNFNYADPFRRSLV